MLVFFSRSSIAGNSYEDLCAYDDRCSYLKNADGSFIPTKPALVKVLTELKGPIRVVANQMGVDPRAVAGAILAENSLNVQVDEDVHSLMEKIKANPVANSVSVILRGKSFSLGLGQIKPESAFEAETTLARIEKRPMYSYDRVKEEILNPLGSLKYAAAILRQCQDEYMKNGFDISRDIGALTTLYNIGKCSERVVRTKQTGKVPNPNYFGFFVNQNIKEIEKVVDSDKPYRAEEANALEKLLNSDGSASATAFVRSLKKKTVIHSFPPQCSTVGAGNSGQYVKAKTYQNAVAIGQVDGDYKISARGIDCDMEDWSLIRTNNGESGWVANETLNENSSDRLASKSLLDRIWNPKSCSSSATENCMKKVAEVLKRPPIRAAEDPTSLEMKLIGGKDSPDVVNVKEFTTLCLANDRVVTRFSSEAENQEVDPEEIQTLIQRLERKKSEIDAVFGKQNWENGSNAFENYIDRAVQSLKTCEKGCIGPVVKLKEFLADDMNQYKGYKNYTKMALKYGSYFSFHKPYKEELEEKVDKLEKMKRIVREIDTSCQLFFDASPASAKEWVEAKPLILRHAKRFYSIDDNLVNICKFLSRSTKNESNASSTQAEVCESCRIMMSNGSSSSQVSEAVLAGIVRTPQDRIDYFSTSLESFKIRGVPPDSNMCNYDPFESAKLVEEVSKTDCVQEIFVPDMFIVNKLRKNSKKVIYRPFDNDDRFSFTIKNACSEVTR